MNIDPNNIAGMVQSLFRILPGCLAVFTITQLAVGRFRAWKSPIAPVDAAYTLVAVAAFAYVLRT